MATAGEMSSIGCAKSRPRTEAARMTSCTSGLMLVLRAAELSGDVIAPSFTFAANGLVLSFDSRFWQRVTKIKWATSRTTSAF